MISGLIALIAARNMMELQPSVFHISDENIKTRNSFGSVKNPSGLLPALCSILLRIPSEDRKLKKSDFVVTEHYHARLREQTAKLLIGKLQLNLNRRVSYKNKQFMYDGVLQDNVQILANHIQDKQTELQFCIPAIKIGRDDNIEMRETILRMTPEQRKARGISKTTLWYMQKNLREGKRIKIYEKVKDKLAGI
jgi:CRISPR-associated protein Cas1